MAFLIKQRSGVWPAFLGCMLLAVLFFPQATATAGDYLGTPSREPAAAGANTGQGSSRDGFFHTDPQTGDQYMGTVPKPPQDYGYGEGGMYPGNVYPEIYVGWPGQDGSGFRPGNRPGGQPGWRPGGHSGWRPGRPGGSGHGPGSHGPSSGFQPGMKPGGGPSGHYPGFRPGASQGQSPGLAPGGSGGPGMRPPGYQPSRPGPSPQGGPGGKGGGPSRGAGYPSPTTRP